jgi:exocyst complex component 2
MFRLLKFCTMYRFVICHFSADIESKLRQIEDDPEGAGTTHLYSVTQRISGVANRAFEPLFERQVYH